MIFDFSGEDRWSAIDLLAKLRATVLLAGMGEKRGPGGAARRRVTIFVLWALAAALGSPATAFARAPVTLQVVATHGLLEFHHSALSRFLAAEMTRVGLADWRFAPEGKDGAAADRVEWSFKLNPYAGGEVRSFVHSLSHEESFGRRPATIEVRLYLDGQYQTLVEAQAFVRGTPDDPDLAAAVVRATRNLLGPNGAYRAIDMGQYRTNREN